MMNNVMLSHKTVDLLAFYLSFSESLSAGGCYRQSTLMPTCAASWLTSICDINFKQYISYVNITYSIFSTEYSYHLDKSTAFQLPTGTSNM